MVIVRSDSRALRATADLPFQTMTRRTGKFVKPASLGFAACSNRWAVSSRCDIDASADVERMARTERLSLTIRLVLELPVLPFADCICLQDEFGFAEGDADETLLDVDLTPKFADQLCESPASTRAFSFVKIVRSIRPISALLALLTSRCRTSTASPRHRASERLFHFPSLPKTYAILPAPSRAHDVD